MILYRKMKRGILIEHNDPHFKPYIIEGKWKYEEKFSTKSEKAHLFDKVSNCSSWFSYEEQERFVKIGEYKNV